MMTWTYLNLNIINPPAAVINQILLEKNTEKRIIIHKAACKSNKYRQRYQKYMRDTGKSWIRILQILTNAPFPGTWSKKPMTAAVVAAFWLARHVTFRSRVTMSAEVSCYAVMSSDSPLLSTVLMWKQSLGPPGTTPNYLSKHVMLFHVSAWMQ